MSWISSFRKVVICRITLQMQPAVLYVITRKRFFYVYSSKINGKNINTQEHIDRFHGLLCPAFLMFLQLLNNPSHLSIPINVFGFNDKDQIPFKCRIFYVNIHLVCVCLPQLCNFYQCSWFLIGSFLVSLCTILGPTLKCSCVLLNTYQMSTFVYLDQHLV